MVDYQQIGLRPARDEDREFSYQVKKLAEGHLVRRFFGWNEQAQREFHAREWDARRPCIIEHGCEPIGTLSVTQEEGALRVGQFFILPQYQGKGIGSYLLQIVLATADGDGQTLRLAFLKGNRARQLYERFGFRVVREDDTFSFMERKPETPG